MRTAALMALTLGGLTLTLGGCGYHVSGHTDMMPSTIHTIYVPAWRNGTVKYKLTDLIPEDITREFIAKTRYRVVNQPDGADAILTGTILRYNANPAIFDPATARASVVDFEVALAAKLVEKSTGKTLWENTYLSFRQRYEIASASTTYFDESDPAVQRLARDVARNIVSAILSNF